MKKVLLLTAMLAITTMATFAQSSLQSRYGKLLDTITNTGNKLLTSPRISGAQQTTTVSFSIPTVVSGTVAGVVRLYGSLDGVVYTRITAAELRGNSVAPVDSLVINVNAQKKHWVIPNSPYQYYQTSITGIGTTVFTVQGKIVAH